MKKSYKNLLALGVLFVLPAYFHVWGGALESTGEEALAIQVKQGLTVKKIMENFQGANFVFIDCFIHDEFAKIPVIKMEANNSTSVGTDFYSLTVANGLFQVLPKAPSMKTPFLGTIVDNLNIVDSTPKEAIKALGDKLKTHLSLVMSDRYNRTKLTMDFKNQSVQSILIAIAVAAKSNRLAVCPLIGPDGSRVPGTEGICF